MVLSVSRFPRNRHHWRRTNWWHAYCVCGRLARPSGCRDHCARAAPQRGHDSAQPRGKGGKSRNCSPQDHPHHRALHPSATNKPGRWWKRSVAFWRESGGGPKGRNSAVPRSRRGTPFGSTHLLRPRAFLPETKTPQSAPGFLLVDPQPDTRNSPSGIRVFRNSHSFSSIFRRSASIESSHSC
jgi:hypothetical protein